MRYFLLSNSRQRKSEMDIWAWYPISLLFKSSRIDYMSSINKTSNNKVSQRHVPAFLSSDLKYQGLEVIPLFEERFLPNIPILAVSMFSARMDHLPNERKPNTQVTQQVKYLTTTREARRESK